MSTCIDDNDTDNVDTVNASQYDWTLNQVTESK